MGKLKYTAAAAVNSGLCQRCPTNGREVFGHKGLPFVPWKPECPWKWLWWTR